MTIKSSTRKVTITVRDVGQSFGCDAVVRDAKSRKKLAETRTYPFGMRAQAYSEAQSLVAERGWTVADAND